MKQYKYKVATYPRLGGCATTVVETNHKWYALWMYGLTNPTSDRSVILMVRNSQDVWEHDRSK